MQNRIYQLLILLIFCGLVCTQPVHASSVEPPTNEKVFDLLNRAYEAQISLSFQYRSYDEAVNVLTPYFTNSYADLFLKDNLKKDPEGYIVYGSDFAFYYIPRFSYSEDTKVVYNQATKQLFVYEEFTSVHDGPVSYSTHYETLTLERHDSNWVVSRLTTSAEIPDEVMSKGEGTKDSHQDEKKDGIALSQQETNGWAKFIFWNPYKITLYSLLEMDYRAPLYAGNIKGTL